MKIIVAGGSGFVGGYVADSLSTDNDVYIIGRDTNKPYSESRTGEKFPYYFCDYSKENLKEIIDKLNPDAVVNFAAQRPEGKSDSISLYYRNLMVAANIYEVCFEKNVYNIVDTSSRMIYSSDNSLSWSEEAAVNPSSYYALSKLWVEQTAAFFNKKGMMIKILRLAQVIGLGEKQGFILQTYLNNARKGLPIKVFGKEKGRRHYIYAKDVGNAIEAAIKKSEASGIFNIGMKNTYSFLDLAETINKVFGGKSEITKKPEAKADETIYHMSIKKAERELGWSPGFDLRDAYLDLIKDIEYSSG